MRKGGPRIPHPDVVKARRAQGAITPPEAVEAHVPVSLQPVNHYTDRKEIWKDDNGYWRQPNSTKFSTPHPSARIRSRDT